MKIRALSAAMKLIYGNSGREGEEEGYPINTGSPGVLGTLRSLNSLIIKLIITPSSDRMFLLKAFSTFPAVVSFFSPLLLLGCSY